MFDAEDLIYLYVSMAEVQDGNLDAWSEELDQILEDLLGVEL